MLYFYILHKEILILYNYGMLNVKYIYIKSFLVFLVVLNKPGLAEQFDKEFKHYAPIEFQYERSGQTSEHISHEIRKFYFGNKPINNNTETENALGRVRFQK